MFDLEKLRKEQELLIKKIDLRNIDIENIKTIAGVDVAYFCIDNCTYGVCCIDVFDFNSFEVIEKVTDYMKIDFPYIPGYLSYRELPVIMKTYEKLKNKVDVFMLDGNGYLHPFHLGIATKFSIDTSKPSIGVAKSYYQLENSCYTLPNNVVGDISFVKVNNEIYGASMRSLENCNPIYISPGNYISMQNAIDITKKCLSNESKVPIPTRIADIDTHIERKKLILRKEKI